MVIEIEKIVHGGYGFSRSKDGVLLVPYTVTGDIVDVVCSEGENPKFCWVRNIIKYSPYRIEPKCPNFKICGGCDFQHIKYDFEVEVKREILKEDLLRIASVEIDDIDIIYSKSINYRNNVQFKTDVDGRIGFFMKRSTEVVSLPESGCPIVDDKINCFVLEISKRTNFKRGGFRVRSNREGEIFKKGIPGIEDDKYCYYRYKDIEYRVDIDGFFQINNFLYEPWLNRVIDYTDLNGDDFVVDLFSGVGFVTLPMAKKVKRVIGMELNGKSVKNAIYNSRKNKIDNAYFKRVDVNRGFYLKDRPNRVVVDPPRSGLSKRLIKEIGELKPEIVVYASCEPSTFARDIKYFNEMGMVIDRLTMIDMFPRTSHMEVISRLIWK